MTCCAAATIWAARAPPLATGLVSRLLRHGHVFREDKKSWTVKHQAWVRRQRLSDPLAHEVLALMLIHLDYLFRRT